VVEAIGGLLDSNDYREIVDVLNFLEVFAPAMVMHSNLHRFVTIF